MHLLTFTKLLGPFYLTTKKQSEDGLTDDLAAIRDAITQPSIP